MQTEKNRFAAADRLRLGRPAIKDIESVREKIRKQPFESAFVWDSDGNLLAARDGKESKVVLKGMEYENATGGVILHSHPNQTPFSDGDLTIARDFRIARMEVVSKKFHYLLEQPTDGWGRVSSAIWDEEMIQMTRKCDKILARVNEGKISDPQGLEEMDQALLRFATYTKCHYSRISE